MTIFRRFVAIGDSTTEGLEDPTPRAVTAAGPTGWLSTSPTVRTRCWSRPPWPGGRRVPITGDFDWAVNYPLPWLGKGVRRLPYGLGIERKRPVPTIVPKSQLRVD